MIKVNLLATAPGVVAPRPWLPQEQRSALAGLALLVLTAVGVGGWWYYLHHTRVALDTRISTSETELARLKEAAKLVADTTARKTELAERLSLINDLRATKRGPVQLLEIVSQSVPDGLWLLDIKETGNSTQIDGRATSLTAVTDFAERLQNSGLFQRPVEILTTTTETLEDATFVHFSVKADIIPPEPSSTASTSPGAMPSASAHPSAPTPNAPPAASANPAPAAPSAAGAAPVTGKAGA